MSTEKIPESLKLQIEAYIANPDTRVYINHNNDTGKWLYSVVVENSDDFWLDSFKTKKGAEDFIQRHGLKMAD